MRRVMAIKVTELHPITLFVQAYQKIIAESVEAPLASLSRTSGIVFSSQTATAAATLHRSTAAQFSAEYPESD